MTEMSFRHHKKFIQKVFKPHTKSISHGNASLNIHTTTIIGMAALTMETRWPMVRISHRYSRPTGKVIHTLATMKSHSRQLTIHHITPISIITTNTQAQAIWIILTNKLQTLTATTHRMLILLIKVILMLHTTTGTIRTLISMRRPISTHNIIHRIRRDKRGHVYKRIYWLIQTLNLSKIEKILEVILIRDHQRLIIIQKSEKKQSKQ